MSINVFLQYWKDAHLENIGHPYLTKWGKDQKILKALLNTYGASRLTKLIDAFFIKMKTDDFLKRTGASIGIFFTQVPKLLMNIGDDVNKSKGKL